MHASETSRTECIILRYVLQLLRYLGYRLLLIWNRLRPQGRVDIAWTGLDPLKTERRVATSKGVFEVPGFETRIRNAKVQRKRWGDYAAYYCLGRRDLLSFKVFNWPKKHTFSGVQTDMFALLDKWKLLAGLGMFLFGMFMMEQSMKLLSGRTFKVMTRRHAGSRLLPMLGISGLGLFLLAQTLRCRLAGGGCVQRGAALDVF